MPDEHGNLTAEEIAAQQAAANIAANESTLENKTADELAAEKVQAEQIAANAAAEKEAAAIDAEAEEAKAKAAEQAIADQTKDPQTVGEKKVAVALEAQAPNPKDAPVDATVTVPQSDLFGGIESLAKGIAVLTAHSAANIAGSLIAEALVHLQAAEVKIKALQLK